MNGPARDGDRLTMPQTRLSILCYRAGQARPAGLATAASGPSTAALLSRIATACTPAHAREEKGQWDAGTCACCKGATIASPADRVRLVSQQEIICGFLGVPRVCAHVPAWNSLSLLVRCLR